MKALKIPFHFENGSISETRDQRTIEEQKIVNVLVTSRLERVNRPSYGAGARELLYELNDELVFFDFKVDAIQECRSRITSCQVVDIRARENNYIQGEETVMMIDVLYRLPLGSTEVVSIDVAEPGSITEDTDF